jgi:hypothetical protein
LLRYAGENLRMMLLFLVDSKKMMALGAPYVRGPTAPQLGEDLSGRVMARLSVKRIRLYTL